MTELSKNLLKHQINKKSAPFVLGALLLNFNILYGVKSRRKADISPGGSHRATRCIWLLMITHA